LLGGGIRRIGHGYALAAALAVDPDHFEHSLVTARAIVADDPASAAAILRSARALWRGRAFGDLEPAGDLLPEGRRLDALRHEATALALACDIAVGRHRAAVPELSAKVAESPMDEDYLYLSMTAGLFRPKL
jgi:hypothetical protein